MFESSQCDGVTYAQSEILSYWNSIRGQRALPRREDIDPGEIRAHLASISILKLSGPSGIQFRLVGSKIRSAFKDLHQEIDADLQGIWGARLLEVAEARTPLYGVVQRGHLRHAWLRLPLDAGPNEHCQILCHDALISAQQSQGPSLEYRTLSNMQSSIAA